MEIPNEKLAETFKESGLTQQEFCSNHGIKLEKLRYYLYKRSKSTPVQRRRRKNNDVPSFISFEGGTSQKNVQMTAKNTCTVIHGNFSIEELATLISVLESKC